MIYGRACLLSGILFSVLFLAGVASSSAEVITLAQAIDRALKVAPSLGSALANSDLSAAKITEARAPLYPNLYATGEYNQAPGYDERISNRGLTQTLALLTYTVYDGGRRDAQVRAARYAADAARLGVRAAQAQVVFDTTVAYFDLLHSQQVEQVHKESLKRLTGYVAVIQGLRNSGRAIPNDVLRVRSVRDQEVLALETARQQREHSSIVLGSMMGIFGQTGLSAAEVSAIAPLPTGDLMQSPTLRATEREVESAKLAVQAARAERMPSLTLTLTGGYQGVDPPQTFGHHLGGSYDGTLMFPIFDGGLITSHIQQATAAQHAAISSQQQVELQLKRDLADTATRYRSAIKQLDVLESAQTTAADGFELNWARFLGGGTVTLLEVMDSYQLAETFRISRRDQEFAARQASAQAGLLLGAMQ